MFKNPKEMKTSELVQEYKDIYHITHIIGSISLDELQRKRNLIKELKQRNYDINSLKEWSKRL